jgi:hypothetical protein
MSSDAWPSPDAPLAPLPRIEDLPLADEGYDREAVRLAYDSFYRHAARLDASLRALEAVEVFRRDADALRNDLRALRSLGLGGGQSEPAWTARSYERRRTEVPGVLVRLVAESALIIAVAVVAGVAHLQNTLIVALMAGAFVIVALSEWLAARARFVPPAVAFLPALDERDPAPYVEAPYRGASPRWGSELEPSEDTEPEALTMIAGADELGGEEGVDPWEQQLPDEDDDDELDDDEPDGDPDGGPGEGPDGDDDDEPEPELADPGLAGRGGMFRRRRR